MEHFWCRARASSQAVGEVGAHVKEDALSFMEQTQVSSRTTSRKSSWVFALILIYFSIFVEKYGASCILHPLFLFSHLPSLLSPQSGCVECRKPEVRNKDESQQTSHFTWKLVKRMNNFEEGQVISISWLFSAGRGRFRWSGPAPNRHFDRDGPQGKRFAKIS